MYNHVCAKQPKTDFDRNSTLRIYSLSPWFSPPSIKNLYWLSYILCHCLNKDLLSHSEGNSINNKFEAYCPYLRAESYLCWHLTVCWNMGVGTVMERDVLMKKTHPGKNAHLSDNLLAGLWPNGRRRMLYIESPFSPFVPHLILAVCVKWFFGVFS